jgi:hypothetical protein
MSSNIEKSPASAPDLGAPMHQVLPLVVPEVGR